MSLLPSINRLNSIDALRGIAALTIVFFHARPIFWIGVEATWKQYGLTSNINALLGYLTTPLFLGGLAVQLFFVLSGYCVHRRYAQNLAENPQAKLNIQKFALRRLWRIYPTYVLALCVTAVVDFYLLLNHSNLIPNTQSNSAFSFLVTLLSLQGLIAPTFGSNTVFWTLALELHLYALYPLLYHCNRLWGPVKSLTFTFIISFVYILSCDILNLSRFFIYQGSGHPIVFMYWFLWTFGFYLAEVEVGRAQLPRNFILYVLIGTILTPLCLVLNKGVWINLTSAFMFGGIIYYSKMPKANKFWQGFIGNVLSYVGIFSYSIYAIHRPVLILFQSIISPNNEQFESILPFLIAVCCAIFGGYLFFITVEKWTLKPILSFGKSSD